MTDARRNLPERQDPERLYRIEGRYGNLMRWGLFVLYALALWSWRKAPPWLWLRGWPGQRDLAADLLVACALTNLVFGLIFLPPRLFGRRATAAPSIEAQGRLLVVAYLLDHLYVTLLIGLTGGFRSEFYLLYAILALKAAVYYPYVEGLTAVTLFSGPLWVIAAYASARSLFFVGDRVFQIRYLVLFLLVGGCLAMGRLLKQRQRFIVSLDANLSQKSRDLDSQGRMMQETANELATRLLELRSLQESVKAINSSLSLDELLQMIVEGATRVLHGARCSIALVDERREMVVTKAAAGVPQAKLRGTSFRIGQGVAGWVVEHRQPALISAVEKDPRFVRVGDWPVASLLSVPLMAEGAGGRAGQPQVIGALTATSPEAAAFTTTDVSLLEAFADQAAIAVKNAALYEQLAEQEKQTAQLYQSVLEKSGELEAILAGIGDGVIVVDPGLYLMMMNPVAVRIFHVRHMPEPGARLPEIIANEELLGVVHDTLNDVDRPVMREIILPEDGDRALIYQSLATVIKGTNGRVRGVVIVMRDITTQREVEQVKSNFLSVVSHELRTPLHSIKGFVDIILMGKTGQINDLQRDFLTTVKESTTNLQRLIDDLLEFSRMEAGKIKLEPEQVSLHDITNSVFERLRPLADEGHLHLVNQVPENVALIEADPMRIGQVLTNLVSNATKFTPEEGSITVATVDQGDQVEVSVADTGIGIPKEELKNIFQRFYQVDSSATRSYRGAGLGLTICRFIVEYHRGAIWAESEVGRGSTFRFLLPKRLPQDRELVIDFTTPVPR
ncbi:MAG: ATP-binding protein [Chloroflexota bacterium]